MAGYEHSIRSYEVRDILDDIASAAASALSLTLLLAAGCSTAPRTPPPAPGTLPPTLDASYDWHVLLTAPFGTSLKDMPMSLHEVLLFHEAQSPPPEDAECYGTDSPAPRFATRMPDQYLLCFKHDRLAKIEAKLLLPAAEASQIVADVCRRWPPPAAPQAAMPQGTTPQPGCEGTEGAHHFSAHLDTQSEPAQAWLDVQLFSGDTD